MLQLKQEKAYRVLGIDISPYSKDEFYTLVEARLQDNDPDSPPFFVVTVNPEIVIESITDNEFKSILTSSSINTADGVGITWAVNYLYRKNVDRITGSDSMGNICALCAEHQQSIFLYGAMPNVADKTAEKLKDSLPGLEVEGTYSPDNPHTSLEELPFDTQYYLKRSSVIFVALGAPDQEKWIHENLRKLPNCKLIIGVGGTFDYVSGKVHRAPSWVCKIGLEWLYRLISQPSRWRRMIKLPLFALNVLFLKLSNSKMNPLSRNG